MCYVLSHGQGFAIPQDRLVKLKQLHDQNGQNVWIPF